MKPDGGLLPGEMEEADIEPSELFTQLGMLVVESRLPDRTAKGRRRGPHCPGGLGETTTGWHTCDNAQPQCHKATLMRKQIQSLWRNRVPMCIEVVLVPDCSHGNAGPCVGDVSWPTDRMGSLLLEQWTIQVLPKRASDSLVSMRMLFQAVQSHLYFSQLSAWLNITQGKIPNNVYYRISPPGDFCTSSFSRTPELHTFPSAAVSKSLSLRVTVGCLPRMTGIPHVQCHQPAATASPEDRGRPPEPARRQKPALWLDGITAATSMVEYTGAKSPQGGLMMRDQPANYHTGAIPKQRLPRKSPPPLPLRLESTSTDKRHSAGASMGEFPGNQQLVSPKVIVTGQKSPPGSSQVYYSKVNRLLQRAMHKDTSSTDSDGSGSPDIDRFLSKTLASRLDPLTPQEMENYLDNLVNIPVTTSCVTPSTSWVYRTKEESEDRSLTPSSWMSRPKCESTPRTRDKGDYEMRNRKQLDWSSDSVAATSSRNGSVKDKDVVAMSSSFQSLLLGKSGSDLNNTFVDDDDSYLKDDLTSLNNSSAKNGTSSHKLKGQYYDDEDDSPNGLPTPPWSAHSDEVTFQLDTNGCDPTKYSQNGATTTNGCQTANGHNTYQNQYMDPLSPHEQDTTEADCVSVEVEAGSSPTPPFHKSISCPGSSRHKGFSLVSSHEQPPTKNANNLLRNVMRREAALTDQNKENITTTIKKAVPIPSEFDKMCFQKSLKSCANMIFHAATGLPMQSSPAPVKKRSSDNFDYDINLTNPRAIKNSISCVSLDKQKDGGGVRQTDDGHGQKMYSTSAPASTNCLLGNFEESMLNGRLEPTGVVEGFTADIGASGAFCPKHVTLPMTAFFFSLSDDNAPSPYLGHINLEQVGRRGYHVPKKGTVQVTIFNPNKTVVKMFVVVYNLADMPATSQTFLRQRTLYMPVQGSPSDTPDAPSYLRYLIHLRFSSSKTSKIYLHTDIRLIFARDKFEFDSRVENYELRSFTEGPVNPKFSPKR